MLTERQEFQNVVSSVEAEQSLIGGLLINPTPVHDVLEVVGADDFYNAKNRIIFRVIASLVDAGTDIDLFLVADKVAELNDGNNELPYLAELSGGAAGSYNAVAYAKVIFEKSVKRQTLEASNAVSRFVVENPTASIADVETFAQGAFAAIESRSEQGSRVVMLHDALKEYVNDLDRRFRSKAELQGLSSGFEHIDRYTNGYKPGHLIVIAGRPSMGKTTYALQKAGAICISQKKHGLFFSLEMSQNELTEKLIACFGDLDLEDLQTPHLVRSEDFWPKVEATSRRVKDAHLRIVESPGISVYQIKSYARKVQRKQPLDFIMIDHIHIMGGEKETITRLEGITSGLKALSIELQIPIFALAQLNRELEKRPDKQPIMADLRGSGSIEQDADQIQFIYRPDYYEEHQSGPNVGLIQLEIAKHRGGKKGKAFFENEFGKSRMAASNRYLTYQEAKPRNSKVKSLMGAL